MRFNLRIIIIILFIVIILAGIYLVERNIENRRYLENQSFYDEIKGNMTQGEILNLIGREPSKIAFIDGGDYGELECWYYEPLFMCFAEGRIVSKSGAKL